MCSVIYQRDGQCTYNVKLRRVRVTNVPVKKAVSIKYSEGVSVSLAIHHVKRMRRIVLSSAACPAIPHFAALPHKRHIFLKHSLNIKCVFRFSLQLLLETFIILRNGRCIRNVRKSSSKAPVILFRC